MLSLSIRSDQYRLQQSIRPEALKGILQLLFIRDEEVILPLLFPIKDLSYEKIFEINHRQFINHVCTQPTGNAILGQLTDKI